ncbi:hypothetical protein O181_010466 [Austropuccinia psidii MF-1]|uniref:ATP-dependent RNA helicase n=1 Tax=Austropuccinia psidii MF-1 TaxID=1389203 RepID=A0A9Q3BTU2_9BASI|nr:hypothetical protein [Austropuccinia psidii MF-1]
MISKDEQDACFDDCEPIGDQVTFDEGDDSNRNDESDFIPSITTGVDSTKPTLFDKLPWKTVKLSNFISDGLSFEADGGLLGLEELDGSVWEQFKSKKKPDQSDNATKKDDDFKTNIIKSTQAEEHQENSETPLSIIDKDARKKAKKERLAKLRRLKKEKKQLQTTSMGHDVSVIPKSPNPAMDDNNLEGIDWNQLDNLSDNDQNENSTSDLASFDESLLPDWSDFNLANSLKRGLHNLSFTKPTSVQNSSLRISLSSSPSPRDLVVIAETGSGKTLAYTLPILNELINSAPLSLSSIDDDDCLPIKSLILTPTRELCLQVKTHIDLFLKAMCSLTSLPLTGNHASTPNRTGVSTVSICGGIAIAKQRKQLERSKNLCSPGKGGRGCIVIATPGRLWDMIQSWSALAEGIKRCLDWLVFDEADKMIERGHFEEIEKILKLTRRPRQIESAEDGGDEWSKEENIVVKEDIRTMVFSATMDKNLQINLKKNWKKTARQDEQTDPMHDLLDRIDFRDEKPELIDLTPDGRTVGGLKECKIQCLLKDKDLYLFHFLLRYSGRTIVFLSSISALRRLAPLLTLLLPHNLVLTLHSEMQQRARLKALDRFRTTSKSILLSTDVAARGLDIPLVEHVIHYQIPRTVDCYVHRSGRTARAGRGGVSLALIAPDEIRVWASLMKSLGKPDMPSPPIEHSISNKLKELLELAKKIDFLEHSTSKQAHEENWLKKTAAMMEVDVDDLHSSSDNEMLSGSKQKVKETKAVVRQLKAKLSEQLSSSIILKGMVVTQTKKRNRPLGNCYITDPKVIETFINGESHEKLIGLTQHVNAIEELNQSSKKKTKLV